MKYAESIIFVLIFSVSAFTQSAEYNYSDRELIESFTFEEDSSFAYLYSVGLLRLKATGKVKVVNDTLVLNSDVQPRCSIKEYANGNLQENEFEISETGMNFPYPYSFIVSNKFGKKVEVDWMNDHVTYKYDSLSQRNIYIFNSNKFSKRRTIKMRVWHSNYDIDLKFRSRKNNAIEVAFSEFANDLGYHFFTNQKAIRSNGELVLLDANNEPIKSKYSILVNRGKKNIVKLSKKERVKIYRNNTQLRAKCQ